MSDLTTNIHVQLPHEVGALARLANAFGAAGVSIQCVYGSPREVGVAVLRTHKNAALNVLQELGIEPHQVTDAELMWPPDNEDGALGRMLDAFAAEGLNVASAISGTVGQLSVGFE